MSKNKYITLPHGTRVRKYEGFDLKDLALDEEWISSRDKKEVVELHLKIFDKIGKGAEQKKMDQALCDTYVDLVEMMKKEMPPEKSAEAIAKLKKMRSIFMAEEFWLLYYIENGETSSSPV